MLRALGSISLCLATAVAQTNFPPPIAPASNPTTADKSLLGMALFFEEQLSSTSTVACATCHDLSRGGIDPRTSQAVNPGPDRLFATADDQRGSPGVGIVLPNGVMLPHPAHGFHPNVTDPRVAAGAIPFDQPTLGSQNGRLVTSIGQGSITSSGQLQAHAPFAPRLGEPGFLLTLSGATPGTPTFIMWDVAASSGGLPFNLELGLTSAFEIFTMGPARWMFTMPTGVMQVPLPLPNNLSLSGQTLFAQWLVLQPSAQWAVSTSNALRIPLL